MSGPPTVVLFDLDGTLVSTGGAGRRAMERACDELFGDRSACHFPFNGWTDRSIARRSLRNGGVADDERSIDDFLSRYLERLREEIAEPAGYRVFPGVSEVVAALADYRSVAVGLGTGNIRQGAMVKLEPGGLQSSFPFGGFGCDAEDRAELLRAGVARGARHLGVDVTACRAVIVGDTTRDVAAALAIGAECVAVMTGGAARDELAGAGATEVFETLADDGVLAALVRGG